MHMPALVVTAAKDDTFLTVSVDQELGAALAVRETPRTSYGLRIVGFWTGASARILHHR